LDTYDNIADMSRSNGSGKEISRTIRILGQRIASLSPTVLQSLIEQAQQMEQGTSPQTRLSFFLNHYELPELTNGQINRFLKTAKVLGESGKSAYLFYLYLSFGWEDFNQNFLEITSSSETD